MYAFIEGKIEEKQENLIVVNTGGVGYEIFCTVGTVNSCGHVGDYARIYTYLHVREDAHSLFGFASLQEKSVFLDLISVSNVGAKTAIAIMSGLNTADLLTAVSTADTDLISKIKGIGKKTAERIVLELKEKYGNMVIQKQVAMNSMQTPESSVTADAINLLITMGLSKYEAVNLIKQVFSEEDTTETLVAKALKNLK